MVESRGGSLTCAVGILYALAVLAFGIRVWAKCTARRWHIDDYSYTAAFILAIIHAILVILCVIHGYGRKVDDIAEPDLEQIEFFHYVGQFLYALSFGLSRISAALFVGVVAQSSPLVWPAHTLAALSGVWSIASVLCLGFNGDVGKPWIGIVTQPLFFRWLGIECTGILLELSLFVLSSSLIWRLQMAHSTKLSLTAAFGVRLLVIPVIAARLVYLQPAYSPTPTWSAITPALLTETALACSITTGCATALRPFLRAFHPTNVVDAARLAKSANRLSSDRYYRLDNFLHGSGSSVSAPPARGVPPPRRSISTADFEWKPYQGFSEDTATSYPSRVHISSGGPEQAALERRSRSWTRTTATDSERDGGAEDAPAAELEPMTIQRTTEVSIVYTGVD